MIINTLADANIKLKILVYMYKCQKKTLTSHENF